MLNVDGTGDKKADALIEKAIKHIEKSLDEKYWINDFNLTDKGKKVFDEHKKAIKNLMNVNPSTAVENTIASLQFIDRVLASTPIWAVQCGGSAKCFEEVDKAWAEFNKAAEESENGKYDKAIDKYKKAWEHAMKAMR